MPKSIVRTLGKRTLMVASVTAWLSLGSAFAQDQSNAVDAADNAGLPDENRSRPSTPANDLGSQAPASDGPVNTEAVGPRPLPDGLIPAAEAAAISVAVTGKSADATVPENWHQIEEIVVTATKREESIRDIPASISAFTGADLEKQGKVGLYDFIQESPGVTASQGSAGFTRITMRGISTDTNPYAGNPSPVGIFIGDTAFTDPYIASIVPDLSAFDLANVEVLKGPQGTLFGGAAVSGAIRYELQEPVLGKWQFRGFSQYVTAQGGGDALTSGAAINVPLLKDSMAFRFDYVKRNYPGIYDNARSGQNDVDHGAGNQVRAILLWEPSHQAKIKLTHLTQDFFAPDAIISADAPHGPRSNDNTLIPLPSQYDFGLDSLEIGYKFNEMRRDDTQRSSTCGRLAKHASADGIEEIHRCLVPICRPTRSVGGTANRLIRC